MEKMSTATQVETRSTIYAIIANALDQAGYSSEAIKGGRLIDLGEGYFGKVSFSVCDATKFSLEKTREEYALSVEKAAERAEKSRAKAEEKAAKEAKKAEEKAE